jgi:hypothetical protein
MWGELGATRMVETLADEHHELVVVVGAARGNRVRALGV